MAKRENTESTGVDTSYVSVVQLWTLRALLRCNGVVSFLGERRFDDPMVARMLGYTDAQLRRYKPLWALNSLQRKLATLERLAPDIPGQTTVSRNLARLSESLGLSEVERDILHLTAIQRVLGEFGDALDLVGQLSRASVCRLYSEMLGHPIAAVRAALDDRGKLARSALLSVDSSRTFRFADKIDMLFGLAEELMLEHEDLLGLFGSSICPSAGPRLDLGCFAHLAEDIAILRGYLEATVRFQQPGVNVLIHGRPGTGKTEFVRALACAAGARLLEIPVEEPGGKPRAGKARFDSYRLAQSLLADADRTILLFDEVEDVFCDVDDSRHGSGNASGVKGWVNQLLERNPVPTFWVTNNLQAIDPAYRRRFDYVLHMDVPPTSVRRKVIDQHTRALSLPESWRTEAAGHTEMVPAVVERAVKVGTLVCDVVPDLIPAQVLTRVMNNTLEALGAGPLQLGGGGTQFNYRLELLNADCDLEGLREGLGRVGEGRICLYGPPGTGKTAFGHHIAEAIDRPLLVKRASDILSPYVGMAERNIAGMFAQARTEGAVLLLDEADSLLRDRQGAQRSWEVTQVNEMLTQMEAFRGIFIASTNLMDSLDAAAMRRFDAQIRLGYLSADSAWQMFSWLTHVLGLINAGDGRKELDRLTNLTPGDFSSVERHCRLNPVKCGAELVARLRQACESKRDSLRNPIGFSV